MSWDQQSYPDYGQYGEYNQYSANHNQYQQPQQQQQAGGGQQYGGGYQPGGGYGGDQQYGAWSHQQPAQAGHFPPGPGQAPTLNIGSQLLQDPMMTNMAMNYGANIGKQAMNQAEGIVEKYIPVGQLKYYFAVDNTYVTKKLGLLLFPFAHSDWSIRYSHDEPVQPRYELNAADLYIPSMAFVTYILVVGYMLGLQDRFSPEVLGTTSSWATTMFILELVMIYLITRIMSINTNLKMFDTMAFCMYKYVGMIFSLVVGMFFSSSGYYPALAYTSLALALFLFRTLHLRVEPEVHGVESHGKRKIWLLFTMVCLQPMIMWLLTYSLIPSYTFFSPDFEPEGLY